MKKILLSLTAMTFFWMSVFAQDIPSPSANLQTLPSGSYVIAMDSVLQGSGGPFNLNAYGLVTYLLNNNVRVRWVIKSAKAKDAIDFSANSSRIKPTAAAAVNRDFKSGPFVIFAGDIAGVDPLIDAFNTLGTTSTAVKVYQTTADVTVDVRYDYKINNVIWKPKAALMNDGLNWTIHRQYLYNAGIRFGESGTTATNWALSNGSDLPVNCYTFASEAHWLQDAPVAAELVIMNKVKQFALDGGNILMECAAVRTYENALRMHSSGGINATLTNSFIGASSLVVYPNPALSYSQFQGTFNINSGGSLKNWSYSGSLQNNEHDHAKAPNSGIGANNIGASVARIKGSSPGGLVFYLGGHNFNSTTTLDILNGIRMYLNAFLTPTNPQGSLKSAAIIHCTNHYTPAFVDCGSTAGPSAAYPLTFQLFQQISPSGPGLGDLQEGNNVIFLAPNTPSGTSVITAPFDQSAKVYYVKVSPAGGCLQPEYFAIQCISSLPVSLKSFTAGRVQRSSTVNLKWTTSTELNNTGFEVQRNLGNNNWQTVAFVNSQALNGNSSSDITYTYNDLNSSRSVSQYRLRQVDLDRRLKSSEIRSVRGLDQKGGIIIYPNPTNDGRVNVVFEEKNAMRDVSVLDMSGRLVKQMKSITDNSIQIENLTPGMYSLRIVVTATGEQTVEKIIVNNR